LKKLFVIAALIFCIQLISTDIFSQEVPQQVSNKAIYDFLDELAGNHIITINSAVKPYSRSFISKVLKEAEDKKEQLTPRQQKELDFYMMDFIKEATGVGRQASGSRKEVKSQRRNGILRRDLFYYRDSLFSLTVNPILGGEIFSNSSGRATYARNGAEARGYIGKWGFYGSLRDNHEKPLLGLPEYLGTRTDGHIKNDNDWSEMRGGITYSWKWGYAGLVKDNQQWGNNYNGANIFGGNNPSFMQLRLHIYPVKWFEFNYFHGWLNSMVVDSNSSYWVSNSYGTDYREVYHKKFIAANMFTFTPIRNLNISAGNSIIYDNETINPAYLIPLFFYKSVDHSLTSGINNMNSQLFFDISSRQIKNVHLYGTMYIDELATSRFTKKDEWNFLSYKAGFSLIDLPIADLSFTTEFTYSYPLTFQHNVPTLTFQNVGYNLGHFMKDNSREWYLAFDYRPVRTLDINLYFLDEIRGPDYTELGTDRVGNPPLSSVEWHNTAIGLKGSYQIINDLFCWLSFSAGNIRGDSRWSAAYFFGRKNTLNAGVSFGF
jgi:hypothetical protein